MGQLDIGLAASIRERMRIPDSILFRSVRLWALWGPLEVGG
jgi:hypothetical protein